jgi:2-dehydropantoate 2-reductase
MNILVFGAGAIGSLFGGLLAAHYQVRLLGRASHMKAINTHGLSITGKTRMHVHLETATSAQEIQSCPDIILLTVKAYDTEKAIQDIKPIIGENTLLVSLQNGLNNLETITSALGPEKVLAGITTHGAMIQKPGHILHTGSGSTILGELHGQHTSRVSDIVTMFNRAGISTSSTSAIQYELWMKAMVNASINPLTALFQCTNGELKKNPILYRCVRMLCEESVAIAQSHHIGISSDEALQRTMEVIQQTQENRSSMLQSLDQQKPTEIDAITGVLVNKGKHQGCSVQLNTIIHHVITALETQSSHDHS